MSSSSDPSSAQPSQNQDRLRSHFNGYDASAHAQRWDALWSDGSFLPWDRGHANPALIDTLAERAAELLPRPRISNGKRARALVPGCGKGYDVALFAAHGYDAYGIEVSQHAVTAAQTYLAEPGEGPLEDEYKVKERDVGTGVRECVLGDFFDDAWLEKAGGLGEGFDIIYDNTVGAL
jgi:methyl halide transferase